MAEDHGILAWLEGAAHASVVAALCGAGFRKTFVSMEQHPWQVRQASHRRPFGCDFADFVRSPGKPGKDETMEHVPDRA
jgi:hypothetical protein